MSNMHENTTHGTFEYNLCLQTSEEWARLQACKKDLK